MYRHPARESNSAPARTATTIRTVRRRGPSLGSSLWIRRRARSAEGVVALSGGIVGPVIIVRAEAQKEAAPPSRPLHHGPVEVLSLEVTWPGQLAALVTRVQARFAPRARAQLAGASPAPPVHLQPVSPGSWTIFRSPPFG